MILVSGKGERSACELFGIETVVTLLRVIHGFGKSIWQTLSGEVVTKTYLVFEVLLIF